MSSVHVHIICKLEVGHAVFHMGSSSMIEYNVTFECYMLWTSDLFWTRLMCTSLFVLPLVPVSIAVLGQPSWYTLSVVDQISDQVQVTPYLNEVQPDTT